MNLKIYQLRILSYTAVAIVFAAGALFSLNFLYKDFYLVMAQSAEIIGRQKQISPENIDLEKFDQAIKRIEDKAAVKQEVISDLKNPFD